MAQDNIKNLYEALKNDYDLGSEQDFRNSLKDANNRRNLYNAIENDYDLGSEQEFEKSLGYGISGKTGSANRNESAGSATSTQAGSHAQKVVDEYDGPAEQPMSDTQKAQMLGWARNFGHDIKANARQSLNRVTYAAEKAKKPLDTKTVRLGENRNVVTKTGFDDTGKPLKTYITETGNEYENRAGADLEQNLIDKERARRLDPINTELREAYDERERLNAKMAELGERLDKENDSVMRQMAEAGNVTGGLYYNADLLAARDNDQEYLMLHAAANKNDERIRSLEALRDKETMGTFGTIGRALKNTLLTEEAWDGGANDMVNARAMAYSGNVKGDAEKEASQSFIANYLLANMAADKEDREMGDLYRWAKIGGTSAAWAKDFFIANNAMRGLTKGGAKLGLKAAERLALSGWKKAAMKNLGIAAGDVAGATALASTLQGQSTAEDVTRRFMGDVDIDRNGELYFKGGDDIGTAVRKGMSNAVVENYTERIGEHIPSLSPLIKKGLGKLGLSTVNQWISKVGASDAYKTMTKWLQRSGFNGFGNEIIEEELNIALNAIFVGDQKFSDYLDPKTQADIIGGMALSMAFMSGGTLTAYGINRGINAAEYEYIKKKLNNADNLASQRLTPEKWEKLKEEIDGTPNNKIPDFIVRIAEDGNMAVQEKEAVGQYVVSLLRMRGHNLKETAQAEEQTVLDNNLTPEEQQNVHDDGMIHTALLYPTAENGGEPQEVFITKGNVVMRADGTVDTEASSDAIYYKGSDGQVHMTSPDKIQSVNEPISIEEYAAAGEVDETDMPNGTDTTEGYAVGDEVNVNIDGNNFAATVQGTDGNGNVQVYYQNTDGIDVPATFTIEELRNMNKPNDEQPPMGGAGILEEPTGLDNNVENFQQNGEDVAEDDGILPSYWHVGDEIMVYTDGNPRTGYFQGQSEDGKIHMWFPGEGYGFREAFEPSMLRYMRHKYDSPAGTTYPETGNNSAENILQNGNIEQQNIPASAETLQAGNGGQSALERIPKDEQGQPLYEQADPDTAWDAIMEQTGGDENMAQNVADSMVADKEAELKKTEKAKPKTGTTIAEKIAAERERKTAIEQAQNTLSVWQKIAQTSQRRKQAVLAEQAKAAEEAARLRREQEEKERVEREEAERKRREALNGVPDFVEDTPQNARARGYRRVNGDKVDRQQPIQTKQGNEVQVKFDDNNIPTGHVALIDAAQLQPSHINGQRNPLHFIDEAQPKERNDEASVMSARKIAANIRPEEITSSVTAYTGAPTVNNRGEVIQGNNRSAALREMWASHPEEAAKYKQYLTDHAADFGLTPEDVEAIQQPVLVNMLDVTDDDAITLGQFVAQDTESGGTERIKPKNIVQKMGGDMRSFANQLLASPDKEMSFAELVDRNGLGVLKWMQQKGYITPTQYKSAFDSKEGLTAEAKNDLKGIMYQSIFQGGSTHLEEMFNALPAKAQKAILATAYRDFDSPNAERMNEEIQDSISAYYALSQLPEFANAKNYKEARQAAETWKRQYAMDDVTGESYLPAEKYSNFALLLATMYKGQSQTFIQNTFKHIYDLVQGTQEATLFEEPDNTPRTLVEAVNETLGNLRVELLLNENFIYNGQRRSNVLAGGSAAGQQGRQGGNGSVTSGRRIEDKTEQADNRTGTERNSRQLRNDNQRQNNLHETIEVSSAERTEMESRIIDWLSDENLTKASGKTREEIFKEFGNELEPIAYIPVRFMPLVDTGLTDPRIYSGKGYFIDHALRNHAETGEQISVEDVDASKYLNIQSVLDNPDSIKETYVDGKRTVIFIKKIGRYFAELTQVEENGRIVLHKSLFNQKKEPYAKLNDIRPKQTSPEGGISSISHADNTAPAISLQSRDDVMLEESVIWRTPKDAATSSAEKQGLDYAHPNEAEDATKGSGITPQSTSSVRKDTDKSVVTQTIGEKVAKAEEETDTNPTEAQKEAGNYKKGHVRIGQFDITVENPKGSVRRGVDVSGKQWEHTMQNTYGYIRGTEGVDGDHIDVFLTNDIDGWNGRRVYIVDQYNEDGTFDEHKVMLGFNDEAEAQDAYLSNYEKGWEFKHKLVMSSANLPDFEKWINSSHRKTKPFAEYKSATIDKTKAISPEDRISEIDAQIADLKKQADEAHGRSDLFEEARIISESNDLYAERRQLTQKMPQPPVPTEEEKENQPNEQSTPKAGFGITPAQYTTKRGKVLDMFLVTFAEPLTKEQQRAARELAKAEKGWYDRDKEGFMMRSEESAQKLADTITGNEEAVSDAQPLSLADTRKLEEPAMRQVDVEGLMQAIRENGKAKLSDHLMPQSEQKEETSVQETKNSKHDEKNAYGASNKLVSRERYEQLKARMRKKLGGQLNMGIDPEILAIGTEMAAYHIEAGARKFAEYAMHMIADLGDAIRPYLKSFYNGARDLPEVQEAGLDNEMTPYDEVRTFDVANFDKGHSDALATAEMVVAEQEANKQAESAKNTLTEQRNKQSRKERQKKLEQPVIADLFSDQQVETTNESKDDKSKNTATTNAENTEINRKFADAVKTDMLSALDSGTKPYRSILDLRKRAAGLGMEVDNDGRTDILLQELVEDGLVRAAREVVNKHGRDSRESYDLICKLYDMQPTIAARSSNRIKMQQYSTPLPMAWNAAYFVMNGKKDGKVLEPTAGNGMLVFAVPANQVHANELDETRLENLREQGFAEVTQQDAVEPFEGGKQYDVVIANPPFGKREAVNYDGKLIPGLDPQITLNALASMKDDGKASIIIGGNMEYGSNGGLKSMKPFFTYLYDHYNVKGVVDMDGKLYAKQGTTYPTRMILIDGRRSDEERAQTAVYPPVESKAIRRAESFDDLYEIVNKVLNSKEKTNGTEILRSRERKPSTVSDQSSRKTDGERHSEKPRKNDTGRRGNQSERSPKQSENVLRGEHREITGNGETASTVNRGEQGGSRRSNEPNVQRVGTERVSTNRVGLNTEQKKRTLTEEKLPYRPHNTAFSLNSVAPAAMVEAMDNILTQIEAENGNIDEYVRKELRYDTIEEAHQALAAEQMDSVAMAIYQMKKGQALIIGDQTGVGKGRQMAALIRWAVMRGEKPVFITQKADLFSDIYRDLVDIGSGDLVPFIFNSDGAMVDSNGNVVHKPLSSSQMAKVFSSGQLPEDCNFAVLTYSQVNTGDKISQKELEESAKKRGGRVKKSKASKNGKATPKATFLRSIAEDNYLFLDESHTAAGTSNTGAYLQSILRTAKAATFASATFAKRPDTMPLYAIRTAMSQAKVESDKMISIIEKGGVTLQEIMSREMTNAGQMVRRERDMSDVKTDWKTIDDPATVKRARENYDRTIAAFNAIIKFQENYVKPKIDELDKELAITAESAGIKKGTDKMGVENVPFASKTYNYTKQLMLALKVDAIADEVDAEIKAGRHPVIALESTMESTIKNYAAGEIIEEPTFSASLLKGLDTVMQYTVKDENGKETHAYYSPHQLGEAGEKAYYELQDFIRKNTSDIFISPLDAIIERLHEKGYKVGELTGRNMYVERNDKGQVVVKRRTDNDKKKMQREFNNGTLDVLILNKSASTGISLHASEKFSDQRQRTMIIAQPLSDINDYMQMIGRIDRTGQVHRGYYINLGLPVPAENRFLMMLSTKLKSLNANTTTSQDSKSNEVEAPDLLNKYGSQVVVEYLRDNPEIYEKMGTPLKKGGLGGGRVQTNELDDYKPQEDDARKITGYVALLTTKEQEEFYDDVVRRYNELIKYLDDTGSNDLKITVMPLRAKTLEKRISSEGIDPDGKNPFAQNAYVEKVEIDVLRKPMKAGEIRKTIEQINGKYPEIHLQSIIETIQKEHNDKIAAEEQRYEKSKAKAVDNIAKQTEKINRQQKRTADERREAIASITQEINESVEERHNEALKRLNSNRDLLLGRLRMFSTSSSYLVPDNLETMMFDFAAPAIFCGYKAKDKKITASTTLAVFATLDGRRRIEIKLSDTPALQSIYKMTNDNWDAARSVTLENWDSQIPTETRKQGYILTGNILQAIVDTQNEHGGYPGQLISYTDIDGNIHDGILMPDKWNTSMLKSSGAPLSARMEQIRQYKPIVSLDGKVSLVGSEWAKMYYLTVPKTKKDGAVYYENETLLNAANGIFYPFHGELRADIPAKNIGEVVRELTKLGVKVKESNDVVADDISINEEEANDLFRVVDDVSEIERLNNEPTIKVYRAMSLVDGKLYPPMSKKIGTSSNRVNQAPSEFGQWEVSDERPELVEKDGKNKNHIYIVKDNGKGLWVAYNPYFHTSRNPLNDQFAEAYQRPNLVTVEVEVPESELTSGYQAEGAKDPVGETKWNAGPVNRQLSSDKKRKVILSRWMRPVRIVPESEVAQRIAELIEGENVAIPDNTVTPSLLEELKKLGVKIVDGINKSRKKASTMSRNGNGTLTDDDLTNANDPVSKLLGKSTRTARQRREFAERERERMVKRVQELAQTLHLDNVDIVTDASTLQGNRAKAKGFFSRSTGKITIVIQNHRDLQDVEQTLLHEAVAHYGLRKLFGEHFDTFIDNVYNNVSPELKQKIDAMSQKHGWSTRVATEEYLASLAENTNFKNCMMSGWWTKIKSMFLSMLQKLGFEGFTGVTLLDNELRYILWRSYENLADPGRYRSIVGEVRDMAKQHELNVGNYKTANSLMTNAADRTNTQNEDNVLFREAEGAENDLQKIWREEYDRRTLSATFKFREAAQDGMKSVSILQDIISKETGKPIKENENVWALQNRLSSTNKYEQDYFYENFYKPLMRTVGNLVKAGARYDELGRNMEDAQDDILKYLISKHGIERNAHFREVAAMEARQPYEESIEEIRKAVEEGEITRENADKQIEKLTEQANEAEEKSRIDTITRDYSGLSELYNNKMDFDALAEQYVSDFESKFDTADLWNKINAATKMTLRKTYEAGLISRSGYEATRDMYQYYIPLRGWSNDVASEMYNYKGQQGVGGRIMKRAKGRKSLAENPLAVIGRMGQDGILQANKNRVKQRLYNLAIGHDTSLLSISKQWYVNEGTKENPDWQRAYPELSGDMGADEVATALKEFDEKMKALKDEGMATQRRDGLTLKYHTTTAQEQQHRVNVSIGGREYNIYVNGNPRASQAINGELRMDEGDSSIVQRVNRWLANVYTSLNPEFVVTNYERDAGFAAAIVASTETPQYQAGWIKNMAKFNPLTTGVYINSLINKAIKGKINLNNTTERYMQEFLANGGETGFTNMLTANDYKKLINKEIKNVNTGITARKAARVISGAVQRANRVFEDATRFATYVTSREQGRSIDEAIRDAKEISLNFNTRGADGMRNDGIVHKFFRNLRHWVIFTNPSIQGLNKAGVAFRNHPVRSTIAIAGLPVLLGYGMAALASALLGDDDDEKVREAYMDLPKWVRRTNVCIPIGGTKFVTIPLSYELRVSYGMGEMFWEIEQGLIEPGELAKETLKQISDLLPLSFANGTVAQNVSPTIVRPLVDIIQNKDFTGRPIWRENTFNQNMPEYTKAYAGTAKWFTKSAEVLNNAIPKFWIKDYPSPDKYTPGALDINPAIVEHLFDSYLGGLYTFPAKAAKTISMVWDEDMRDVRNIPFLNRNIKDSRSGNPINRSAGDRYNTYMKEYRLSKQRWDGYRRETNHGVTDFLDKLIDFGNTPQGRRMFIINGYKKSLDKIDKQIKDMGQYEDYGGDEERKRLKEVSDSLKQELVNKLDSVSVVED